MKLLSLYEITEYVSDLKFTDASNRLLVQVSLKPWKLAQLQIDVALT